MITGLLYDLPVPVQPMKTIAAVALSGNGLTIPEMMAAGIFVSASVLVLGATGLMGVATRLIPAAVIRGMQLGVGLQLAQKGFGYIWYETDGKGKVTTSMNSIFGVNGIFVGLFFVVFILLSVYNIVPTAKRRRGGVELGVGEDGAPGRQAGTADSVGSMAAGTGVAQRPYVPHAPDSIESSISIKCSVSSERGDSDLESGPRRQGVADQDGMGLCREQSPGISDIPAPSMAEKIRDILESKLLKYVYMAGDKACQAVGEDAHTEHLTRPSHPTNSSNTMNPSKSTNPTRSTNDIRPMPVSVCAALPTHNPRNIPAALVIVIVGVILVFAFDPSIVSTLSMGPSTPTVIVPNASEWKSGILRAGLPQLPLTMLNSVISVTNLANQWFPDRYMRPGSIATSVGLMNLLGCWFGAFPSCHGAGGLAAQVRFGARWGSAPILLGLFKIAIALLFGSSLISIFQAFSTSILGAMLVFSGIELASVAKGQHGERGMCIMLLVAAIGLSTKNIAIGVLIGLVSTYILAIWDFTLDRTTTAIDNWKLKRLAAATERPLL